LGAANQSECKRSLYFQNIMKKVKSQIGTAPKREKPRPAKP